MITLKIPNLEVFNNDTQEFQTIKGGVFKFEHSLRSVSKWEAKHHIPFLVAKERTEDENLDYLVCMAVDKGFNRYLLTNDVIKVLTDYMADSHSATTFRKTDASTHKIITSEVIYATMANYRIPFECDKWNLNRLMNLIRATSDQQQPHKKMSQSEIREQNRALNEKRKKELHTKG